VVGRSPITSVLSDKREKIAEEAMTELQRLLDSYGAGVHVTRVQLQRADPPGTVIDAFNDVQRAKADQERARNEAEAYRNDILPRARGDAERIIQDAEAYKEQVVDLAQGEAKRFTSVLQAYRQGPDVIARRLYLDAMEEILKNSTKIIIDPSANRGQGVLPYLPLPELSKKQQGGSR
jgi:membrane protease subunit HflK